MHRAGLAGDMVNIHIAEERMMSIAVRSAVFGLLIVFVLSACNRSPTPAHTAPHRQVFDVVVTGFNGSKIQAIKVVRENTGFGLKEAKDFVEGTPKAIKEGLSEAEAKALADKLRQSDLLVEVRRR